MKVVPYALDVGSIVCYAVYHTGSVPCHESVKGYKNDPGMGIIGQRSKKIVLGVNKDMFLDYGGGRRVRRKGLRRCKI